MLLGGSRDHSSIIKFRYLDRTLDIRHTRYCLFEDLLARSIELITVAAGNIPVFAWLLMIPPEEESNFETFRDCLSTILIERLAPATAKPKKRVKGRKNEIKPVVRATTGEEGEADAAELSEFTEVGTSTSVSHSQSSVAKSLNDSTSQKRHTLACHKTSALSLMLLFKKTRLLLRNTSRHWTMPHWKRSSNHYRSAYQTL
jgi:hypothetical protein